MFRAITGDLMSVQTDVLNHLVKHVNTDYAKISLDLGLTETQIRGSVQRLRQAGVLIKAIPTWDGVKKGWRLEYVAQPKDLNFRKGYGKRYEQKRKEPSC